MAGCEVRMVMQTLRDYFQPDTFDRIFTQMDRLMSYVRTDQPIEKFLMEFGILRQKAEKHMFPAGGGFEDLFICFQCIKAARLKPNEKTLLMASMGGSVEFNRIRSSFVSYSTLQTRRQQRIFFRRLKKSPRHRVRICRMRPGRPFGSNKNRMRGPPTPTAPLRNLQGESQNPKKGRRRRMDSTGVPGNAIGVIAVGVNITFSPNAR